MVRQTENKFVAAQLDMDATVVVCSCFHCY